MDDITLFSQSKDLDIELIQNNQTKILQEYLYLHKKMPLVKYSRDLWFDEPFNDDFIFHTMQCLFPISHLIACYNQFEDDRYIERALSLFYCWYEENYKTNLYKKHNGLITAHRLLVVAELFTTVKKMDLCIVEEAFENVLLSHSSFLENSKNYKQFSSAGLIQDIALFVSSVVLYQYYNNANFLSLKSFVKERLIQQLNYLIHDDGAYHEHSLEQAYHIFIVLEDFYPFVVRYGESDELKSLIKNKMDNLLIFIYAMLEPEGRLPNIGLGAYTTIDLNQIARTSSLYEHIHYLTTNGLEGKKILYRNVYFPGSNYFIYVNRNELNTHFMKFVFYSFFNPTFEKHYDHLSFTLYYRNLPLLIDCGKYKNKESMYYENMISLYGHNSICVDKHDYVIDKTNIYKTGITNITIDKSVTLISAVSCLYEGVLIRRNFLIIKDNYIIIIDELDSVENHLYELMFNFNPKIMLKNHHLEYTGHVDETKYLSIQNLYCTEPCQSTCYVGDKKEYRGFYSKDGIDIEPNHQLVYKIKGSRVLTITLITLNSDLHVSYQILSNQIKFKIGEDDYSLFRNKYYRYLEKNDKLVHDEKTSNKELLNTINDFYRHKR